jgi:GNAT superfamily N-acetyltransferase
MSIETRPMRVEDLNRVSDLSAELGYPVAVEVLKHRFSRIAEDPRQALFVALRAGRVIGWIHAHPQDVLESEPYVEIGGLVVDHGARRAGAGRALIFEVLRWVREQRIDRIRVRSNVSRPEAHHFYPALGFTLLKTQHNYELLLC